MFSVRLHRARKAAGLSLRDLGERVGVSHAAIKKYEDGHAMPSSDVLLGLSRALHVRSEYFFRPEPVALEGIEYRKRSSLPKKRLDAITHEVIDQIERRIELENLFPQSPVKAFAPVDRLPKDITTMGQIEDVAERVREAWDLGFDPIPDLIDVLETNGIRVFMVDADVENKFDGLAARVNGMPIVVVGRHWPGDRQRFTLAHELGHLMLEGRLTEDIDEELACNRFAGAFLFPRASVLQELGEHRNAIELKELGLLKEEFGLSMGVFSTAPVISASSRQLTARSKPSCFASRVGIGRSLDATSLQKRHTSSNSWCSTPWLRSTSASLRPPNS
ncbi:XRE family transcriptional regulator [Burkholderia pseudomallei]|uniref:XRE family transcriptional regulator n=1 Tax=Burkholderia pseudomallei TaxID=28450 RepID=UPI001C129F1D|nr:XRE family transcriptional regulator [Burkholderia pseudomallei]